MTAMGRSLPLASCPQAYAAEYRSGWKAAIKSNVPHSPGEDGCDAMASTALAGLRFIGRNPVSFAIAAIAAGFLAVLQVFLISVVSLRTTASYKDVSDVAFTWPLGGRNFDHLYQFASVLPKFLLISLCLGLVLHKG